LDLARLVGTARFLAGLRLARYDALLLFHHFTTRWGSVKFAALAYASGAPVRAGLDNGRGRFLNLRVPDRGFGAMHEADYWLQVAGLLGANPVAGWRPHIPIDDESRRRGEVAVGLRLAPTVGSTGTNPARPLVAVHRGSRRYTP